MKLAEALLLRSDLQKDLACVKEQLTKGARKPLAARHRACPAQRRLRQAKRRLCSRTTQSWLSRLPSQASCNGLARFTAAMLHHGLAALPALEPSMQRSSHAAQVLIINYQGP